MCGSRAWGTSLVPIIIMLLPMSPDSTVTHVSGLYLHQGGLQRTSYVRPAKLFTANRELMTAEVGVLTVAVRPGAFHQSPSGMGIPGFGQRTLLAPLTRGILCRDSAQEFHECSGGIAPGEVAHFSHHRDGHRELHPAQGLQGFNHRLQAPRFHVILECLVETLEAFGVFVDGAAICLPDDVLRGGADHCREPPEMGRAPMGPAGGAAIVSEEERCESKLGVLKITEGVFTCPSEVS
jgi:hypothetical protein